MKHRRPGGPVSYSSLPLPPDNSLPSFVVIAMALHFGRAAAAEWNRRCLRVDAWEGHFGSPEFIDFAAYAAGEWEGLGLKEEDEDLFKE